MNNGCLPRFHSKYVERIASKATTYRSSPISSNPRLANTPAPRKTEFTMSNVISFPASFSLLGNKVCRKNKAAFIITKPVKKTQWLNSSSLKITIRHKSLEGSSSQAMATCSAMWCWKRPSALPSGRRNCCASSRKSARATHRATARARRAGWTRSGISSAAERFRCRASPRKTCVARSWPGRTAAFDDRWPTQRVGAAQTSASNIEKTLRASLVNTPWIVDNREICPRVSHACDGMTPGRSRSAGTSTIR